MKTVAVQYPAPGRRFLQSAFLGLFTCITLALLHPSNRLALSRDLVQAFRPVVYAGDPSRPEVALTYDDGPNPDATPEILSELEHAHVHATFFIVGKLAQAYPWLITRMVRDGDAVENHSFSHEYTILELPSVFRRSLDDADAVVEAAGAPRPRYFRPPYGVRAPWTVEQTRADGKDVVIWNVPLSDDWDQPGTDVIVHRTLTYTKPGAIIVLHDGNEGLLCAGTSDCDRRQEIAATPILIRSMRARGLHLATIPELLEGTRSVDVAVTRTVAPHR